MFTLHLVLSFWFLDVSNDSEPIFKVMSLYVTMLVSVTSWCIVLRCVHCLDLFALSECTKRGSAERYACLKCNSARAALTQAYKDKGQSHIWAKMSTVEKNAEIKANRDKKPGRGKKFPVEISERVPA